MTISDRQGLSIKLNERGPALSATSSDALSKQRRSGFQAPPGSCCAAAFRREWICIFIPSCSQLANKHKVETLLDTDGDPLLHGLEGHPTIVKPNQSEAERLLNTALITRSQLIDAVRRIKALGPKSVVLSLGARGLIAATATEGILEVLPPPIDAVCPIGAGDAMAAAMVWSLARGDAFSEALRWGVAAGTASAKLPGITLANLEQTKEFYPQRRLRV